LSEAYDRWDAIEWTTWEAFHETRTVPGIGGGEHLFDICSMGADGTGLVNVLPYRWQLDAYGK
jgi:hypothetical protein